MKRALLVLWLALTALAPAQVALLRSEATFQALGWRGRWEWQGARWALEQLGATPQVVLPADLPTLQAPVLVLANARNLEPATVDALRAYVERGGKLLATYQTSYRRADNRSWEPNDFALADLLHVHFQRWAGSPGEANALGTLQLPRHQAMLVSVAPGAQTLATWDAPRDAPAVVSTDKTVFVGEDLFAPECSASPQVLALLADLLKRLAPDLPLRVPSGPLHPPPPQFRFTPLADTPDRLRVGLGAPPHELRLRADHLKCEAGSGQEFSVEVNGDHLACGGKPFPKLLMESNGYLEVLQLFPNQTFRWSAYRGALEITPTQLVNELPLDGYLAGVVPSEVPAWFPAECLKAMAVVARSYAAAHRRRHGAFDLCSEVHCQVYRGVAGEADATTAAVQATAGELLTFAGAIADASFHAVCGGLGESAPAAWPNASPAPYLSGQSDLQEGVLDLSGEACARALLDAPPPAFCEGAGRFRWEESHPWSEVSTQFRAALPVLLGKAYKDPGTLENVEVVRRDSSGRVAELRVVGSTATLAVRGDAIRWLFSGGRPGAGGLNSTLFYLEVEGSADQRVLRLKGGGWGHGVGLCQEGAAGRARAGQGYAEILAHYYPGTVKTSPSPGVPASRMNP